MDRPGVPATPQGGDPDIREFSRIPVVIPVHVDIFPTATGGAFAAVRGTLLNIGHGGGRVRVRWELPRGTRLQISLPVGAPSLRLLAEVVWAFQPPEHGPEPPVYGVRWTEPLSSATLESVLLRQGLGSTWEVTHASRAWKR